MLATSPQAYTPGARVPPGGVGGDAAVVGAARAGRPRARCSGSPRRRRRRGRRRSACRRRASTARSRTLRAALDRRHGAPEPQAHPGRTGAPPSHSPTSGPSVRANGVARRVDHRHMRAERDRARGDLEADEARADDDDAGPRHAARAAAPRHRPACAGGGRPARRDRPGGAAPAGRWRARDARSARAPPAVAMPGLDVERLHRAARAQLDAVRSPEAGRAQRERGSPRGAPVSTSFESAGRSYGACGSSPARRCGRRSRRPAAPRRSGRRRGRRPRSRHRLARSSSDLDTRLVDHA